MFEGRSVKELKPSVVASELAVDSFTIVKLSFQERQCLEQDYLYLKQRNKVDNIPYLIVHLVQLVRVSSLIFGNKDFMPVNYHFESHKL